MAKSKSELSLDDLQGLDSDVPTSDLEARLQKIELFMKRFDGINMMMNDRQVVYHAAYTAILQGLMQFNPSMLRRPDMLYRYLKDAKLVADMALNVHDGGNRNEFLGEFKVRMDGSD